MRIEPKEFDLNKKFPNVLLIGNGALKVCASASGTESPAWSDYILKIPKQPVDEELKKVPNTLLASILSPCQDECRGKAYLNTFKTLSLKNSSILNDLVSLGFDAILTTNFTYEIENCFLPNYSSLSKKANYTRVTREKINKTKVDSKYLLHTYNQFKNSPPIWHIHGEIRRPSSIILTHDEYARLVHKILELNLFNKNKYIQFYNSVKYYSWLDYFLMSNLYIIGLSMDFSEFDLWWLLNRRMREKSTTGKIVFLGFDQSECTNRILKKLNVHTESLNAKCKSDDSYIDFYCKAIEYLKKALKEKT